MATKYTVVQHSAVTTGDPQFEHGLESAAVHSSKGEAKILNAGGRIFDTYGEAEDYAEQEQYPADYSGLIPHAPGTFATRVRLGGRALYIPQS